MRIEYKDPHHITTFTEDETRDLIDRYLSDYYSPSDEFLMKKYREREKVSYNELMCEMKRFKAQLIDDVYEIVNYTHYLMFEDKLHKGAFNKTDIKHLCIIVLAFRLSAVNEQQTIVKAIKHTQRVGKNKATILKNKSDHAVKRALVLAKDILYATLNEERSEDNRHSAQTGDIKKLNKLFQSIYENGKYQTSHQWIDFLLQANDFIVGTNAPSDFSALKDYVENYQIVEYLTYQKMTPYEQCRYEHFQRIKQVENMMRLFRLPHLFHYPSELMGGGNFDLKIKIFPSYEVVQRINHMRDHFNRMKHIDAQMCFSNSPKMFLSNTSLHGNISLNKKYATSYQLINN